MPRPKSKYPPKYRTPLMAIGSYDVDNGHYFVFSAGKWGFAIERRFGAPTPYDWFNGLGFFPDEEHWSMGHERLSDLLDSIPKGVFSKPNDVLQRLWGRFPGDIDEFLKEESGKTGKKLKKVQADYPDLMEMEIRIGPVYCPKAPHPRFCGVYLSFDEYEFQWFLTAYCDRDIPVFEEPGETYIFAETFEELLQKKRTICLYWPDEEIIETLCSADERWGKVIKVGEKEGRKEV